MRAHTSRPLAGLLTFLFVSILLFAIASVAAACSSNSDANEAPAPTEASSTNQTPASPSPDSDDERVRSVSQDTLFVSIVENQPTSLGFAQLPDGGGELYYEIYGEGEPLLLIPGLSANHLSWAEQVGTFSESY